MSLKSLNKSSQHLHFGGNLSHVLFRLPCMQSLLIHLRRAIAKQMSVRSESAASTNIYVKIPVLITTQWFLADQ